MADRGRDSSEKKKKKLSKADKIFEKLKACSSHYMKKKKRHIICDLTRKHTAANIERNRKARAAYARRKQKREQQLRNSGPQSHQGVSAAFSESNDEDWSEIGGKMHVTLQRYLSDWRLGSTNRSEIGL